jgi:tRNA pseudouridine(38-40) synthase
MRNLKLTVAYDGTDFAGWQIQPEAATVQGTLSSAIGRLTGEKVLPQGSGRTDAGVHALAQVATFQTGSVIPTANLVIALNDILPASIRVLAAEEVAADFHPRKSVQAKTYRYRIYRETICPPLLARYVWHYPYPLDENAMRDAASLVEGERDFTSVAAVDPELGREGVSNVRRIFSSQWRRESSELIYEVRGNGFLHHMVRNLVGTFLLIGKGTLKSADVTRIIEAKDRSAAGATAPARGLFLVNVEYSRWDMMATEIQIGSRQMSVVNPATGKVLREFWCATPADVSEAVSRARIAQPTWEQTSLRKRLSVVKRFQCLLSERKQQIARVVTSESGKPYAEALLTEILVALDTTRFLLNESYGILHETPVPHGSLTTKTKRGRLIREPHGVIGIISPWNYPFSIPAGQSLAALAAGNAVVLKPSELTPLSALELSSLFHDAGFSENLFQVVLGDGSTGAALVESDIDKLIFTGSVATGKRIGQTAAARLLPAVLELGGKDPMIVLNDADIEVASSGAVWAAFVNAGQTCLSVERCYVHRSIYESFVSMCAEKAKQLRLGDGMDAATDIGPLIHERQLRTVEQHVEDARSRGARILTGGKRMPSLGPNFYSPAVLADVTHEMLIMREESFGPVLPIMAFDSDDEAVRLANDSEYGLAASVWTRNRSRGEAIARQIKAGTVMINDAVSCYGISEAPHGGIKASGIGRTHGKLGLGEMVRVKYMDVDLMPGIKKPWWYGYGASMSKAAGAFLDFQFTAKIGSRLIGGMRSIPLISRRKL